MRRALAAAGIAVMALLGLTGYGNPITHHGTCPGPIASCVKW